MCSMASSSVGVAVTNRSHRKVLATCKNDFCNNTVEVEYHAAKHAYCLECRKDAKRMNDRRSYELNRTRIRRRRKAERDRKPRPMCWWPGCDKLVSHSRSRHCEFHLVPSKMMSENHWVELKLWINEQLSLQD